MPTEDIDSRRNLIRLQRKGTWPQYVPLDHFTLAVLRAWWRTARPKTSALFCVEEDKLAHPGRPEEAMRKSWHDIGLKKTFDERTLRYSFFLKRLREGAAPGEVMHLLRLTSIRHIPTAFLFNDSCVHVLTSGGREGARP